MNDAHQCPQCGSALPPDAPAGPCPACLARALDPLLEQVNPGEPSTDREPGAGVEIGAVFDGYTILAKLDEGGFAIVYRARQESPKREVALKVLKPGMDSEEVLARFAVEREVLASMNHPNIARVFGAGYTPRGRPYFAMELVENGLPITAWCDQHGLDVPARLELMIQVCAAVQHAHQRAVIHRDLKPSNILVSMQDGVPVPKVIDFGIAKAMGREFTDVSVFTGFNAILGTFPYMSPEQVSSGDLDTRTDVFALGAILYELLAGFPPAGRNLPNSPLEWRLLILEQEITAPSHLLKEVEARVAEKKSRPRSRIVQGELDWIVLKALSKEPDRRYESATALAGDLRNYLDKNPVLAGPPSKRYRMGKFFRKYRVQATAAALVILTLIAATAFSVRQAVIATAAQAESEKRRTNEEVMMGFMWDTLRSPTPTRSGRDVTVAERLDSAMVNLNTEFKGNAVTKAAMLQVIGNSYEGLGLPAEALEAHRMAAALRGEIAPGDKDTLESRMHVALGLQKLGKFKEARQMLEELYQTCLRNFGEDHEQTISTAHNLAGCIMDQGELREATVLLEKVVAQRVKLSKKSDPKVQESKKVLGDLYVKQERYDEGEQMLRDVVNYYRIHEGKESPFTIAATNSLALILIYKGDGAGAEKILLEILKPAMKKLGPSHEGPLHIRANLAKALNLQGRENEAEVLYQEVWDRRKEIFGETHLQTIDALNGLALAQTNQGKYDEALPKVNEVIKNFLAIYGPNHPHSIGAYRTRAYTLWGMKRLDEAAADALKATEDFEGYAGKSNSQTLRSRSLLSGIYRSQGNLEALVQNHEALYEGLYEWEEKHSFPVRAGLSTAKVTQELVVYYNQLGNSEAAERWSKKPARSFPDEELAISTVSDQPVPMASPELAVSAKPTAVAVPDENLAVSTEADQPASSDRVVSAKPAAVAVPESKPGAASLGDVPSLLSPSPNEALDNGRWDRNDYQDWKFSWTSVEGAQSYQLLATKIGAAHPIVNVKVNKPSYVRKSIGFVHEDSLEGWHWRVCAIRDGKELPWTEFRPFRFEEANLDPIDPAALAENEKSGIKPARPLTALKTGTAAPDPALYLVENGLETHLSAFRGKVVVVLFWNSGFPGCHPGMIKFQTLAVTHPHWHGEVEVLTVSNDANRERLNEFVVSKDWDHTRNLWVGPADPSPAMKQFQMKGVPVILIIDREGIIAAAGHPASLDVATLTGRLLEKEK